MKVKITHVARDELDMLDQASRRAVLAELRAIPAAASTDPLLGLSGRGSDVRVHRLPGPLRALYRVMDVDDDGEDEVVILQLVDIRAAAYAADTDPPPDWWPARLRRGREIATLVAAAG